MRALSIQILINRVARTRRPILLPQSCVDWSGDVDVPADIKVEGGFRHVAVWLDGKSKPTQVSTFGPIYASREHYKEKSWSGSP